MAPVKTKIYLALGLAALGLLAFGIFQWNVTHFHLGYWAQVHTGTVNEPGPYYGFFSGFGSDLGEVVLIGGVATLVVGLWHKFNCHNEKCWRLGLHHVAGGQYVVCRKHNNEITGHPHRKLSTEFLRRAHCEHIESLGCQHDGHGTGT
jgi:hypothetical protein